MPSNNPSQIPSTAFTRIQFPKGLVWIVLALIVLAVFFSFLRSFWYFDVINNDEVGVKIKSGQIMGIAQPGIVYDFGLFVNLVKIKTSSVAITVDDAELITSDKQRIGLQVSADVFRPSTADVVTSNYARYKTIYIDDASLQQRMMAFTLQAMKVCVGDKKFDEAIIGSGRDVLRSCIDDELSKLAQPLGLEVRNVAVPQVTISPVQSRLATEKAKQDTEKAKQEATAQQAVEEGRIRVDQSKLQEESRQQATLQQLKQQQLVAELKVIEQERINAQAQVELTKVQQQIAKEQAQIDIAKELALANLYAQNPEYVALLVAQANAQAIKATDKIIFAPEGNFPNFIFTNGINPSIAIPK
jgi:hypothetical protein